MARVRAERGETRKPGKAPLSAETVTKVLALPGTEPPGEATHWTGRAVARAVGVSLRAVQRIWQATRCSRTVRRFGIPHEYFRDMIDGVASVNEAAVTGESAPVIRESGGDRSAVTGGTRVLSDWIVMKVTVNPGETFIDRMIAMVENAKRWLTA